MRSRPEQEWKDYNVTARDLVADSSIYILFDCAGCRAMREACVWKIGARLADDPIQRLRFKCSKCGVYAQTVRVARRNSAASDKILTIKLNPACWDDGHETAHRQALARAEKAWTAKGAR